MSISSFHPPRRMLMGPGPSDVSERVLPPWPGLQWVIWIQVLLA